MPARSPPRSPDVPIGPYQAASPSGSAEGGTGSFTDEDAQDAIAAAFDAGTHTGGTVNYDDINNLFDLNFSGGVSPPASETEAGIAELATQAETDTGTDDLRIVTPLKLTTWDKAPKRFQANIGDGVATLYTVTHNLNTRDVKVEVYRNGPPWDTVLCDIDRDTVNSVRATFAVAPTSNQFRVVIIG